MLRNLPVIYKSTTYPPRFQLEKGMCLELHLNGGIIRRGIVYEDPHTTMAFMWWQTRTKYVRGEVPSCTTLEEGLPHNKLSALTIEPVSFFETWLTSVPFSIRFYFGYEGRGSKKPTKKPKESTQEPLTVTTQREAVANTQLDATMLLSENPPWTPPYPLSPRQNPLTLREPLTPPWTPPHGIPESQPTTAARKPRRDKGVKRGLRTHAMDRQAEDFVHQAPRPQAEVDTDFRDAIISLAAFVGRVASVFTPQA